jgi:competence protein ComEC
MKDYPAIKLSVVVALGILLEKYFSISFVITASLVAASVFVYYFVNDKTRYLNSVIVQILIFLSIIASANLLAQLNKNEYNLLPDNIYNIKNLSIKGEVTNIDLIRKDELDFEIKLDHVIIKDSINADDVNLICKLKDNQKKLKKLYNKIKIGNILEVEGSYIKGREERNPGEFDYNKYLRKNGLSGLLYIYNSSGIKIVEGETAYFDNLIFTIRKNIDEQIRKIYNPVTAGFLRGILLADRSEIKYNEKQDFINSGVIHILAVSGLHVGYILLIFTFIFGRFNIYVKSILTIIGLVLFLLITGVPPSAFRATVMTIVLISAFLMNKSTNLLNSVAIAALIILIINPEELFNAGFQLSFSAVISIAVVYPVFREKIKEMNFQNRLLQGLFLLLGVSLAAQIGTLPVTIYYFGKISLVALFTNLLVIPAVGIIVGIGIFSLFLSILLPFITSFFTIVNELLVKTIYSVIHFTGASNLSFLRIHNFSIIDIITFYLILIFFLYYVEKFQNRFAKICLSLLCISCYLIIGSIGNINLFPENKLNVLMIDVGQGDSFLVKFPNGETGLIDAGEANYSFDNGERVILPLMNNLGIDKIDYGFVSHVDLDHYGGFVSLIHKGKIKNIYKPEIDSSLDKDLKFEKYIAANNLSVHHYHKTILKIGNVRIYVLNTNKRHNFSSNNNSGLLKIVYGNSEFLFTGDLEKQGERYYDNYYGKFLDSDVLKVGHHGSKTSSSIEFLSLVTPGISLISAGIQNKFHHPSEITLEKLEKFDSAIYRTDFSGAILLQSNGENIKKFNWRVL